MAMKELKFGIGLWSMGYTADRFIPAGYRAVPTIQRQIEMVGKVKGAEAVQLHWKSDFTELSPKEVRKILRDNGLKCAALNQNIFGDPIFKYGAFTNTDSRIRRKAINQAKKSIEAAHELGCNLIDMWPGQDGFDYCFQSDYYYLWDSTVKACREIAKAAGPKTKVAYEYKLKEPRMFMLIANAPKAALLCEEVGLKNFGVTLDFGHALFSRECPAEAAALLANKNRLFNVHFNDAYGEFDDDLIAGTVNVWKTLEYVWYVKRAGYNGYFTLDNFPFRENPIEAAALSIRMIRDMEKIVERLDSKFIAKMQQEKDVIAIFEYLRKECLVPAAVKKATRKTAKQSRRK